MAVQDPAETPPPDRPRRLWTRIVFWAGMCAATATLVTSLAIPVLTSRGFTDSSPAMEPAIGPGDSIVVAEGSAVRRGDVVVLHHPASSASLSDTYALRVIGLPGDRVACCDARGRVTVNGKPLDETYLAAGNPPSRVTFSVRLRAGQIWVMGDRRNVSGDSRVWGPVRGSGVTGRVILVIDGSSYAALRTPRTFAADGLAPADTRLDRYVWLAALAAASALALVLLTVTGIAATMVRLRRSRQDALPQPEAEPART